MAVVTLSVIGCGDAGDRFRIAHPFEESLVRPVPAAATVTVGRRNERVMSKSGPLRQYADALAAAAEALSLGAEHGPDELTFGFIQSARKDRYGRILVLDGQALELRVFDDSGKLLQVFGGAGDGPGEYRYPRTISLGRSALAAVFDGRGVAHLYSADPDSVSFLRSVRLDLPVEDGCVLGDTLVVQASLAQSDRLLHAFTSDGTRLHSFGKLYDTANPRVRQQISDSRIACVEVPESVIVAPVFLPELRSYDLAGNLKWWTEIEGLRPIDFREDEQGRTAVGIPARGYHGTIELTATSSGLLVHQLAFVTRASRAEGDLAGIETILVDAATGSAVYVGSRVPRIEHASETEILYWMRDPFPRLVVAHLRTAR